MKLWDRISAKVETFREDWRAAGEEIARMDEADARRRQREQKRREQAVLPVIDVNVIDSGGGSHCHHPGDCSS